MNGGANWVSSQSFVADPLSRKDISRLANMLRSKLKLREEKHFPVLTILENVLPIIDENFHYEILTMKEMGNRHGLTYPDQSIILLREDVYENAYNRKGRDRFTVAHEIGHLLMHHPRKLAAARIAPNQKVPAYMDPEWQAHTFAGELLAPSHIIKEMTIGEIATNCGLSLQAARIQYKIHNSIK